MPTQIVPEYQEDYKKFIRTLRTDVFLLDDTGLVAVDGFLDRCPQFFGDQWKTFVPALRDALSSHGGRKGLSSALDDLRAVSEAHLPPNASKAFMSYLTTQVEADAMARTAMDGGVLSAREFREMEGLSVKGNMTVSQYAVALSEIAALEIKEAPTNRADILARYARSLNNVSPVLMTYSIATLKDRLGAALPMEQVIDDNGIPVMDKETSVQAANEIAAGLSSDTAVISATPVKSGGFISGGFFSGGR